MQLAYGIRAFIEPNDDKFDRLLTVYDNSFYVQCLNSHFLSAWRCEAAGLEGQSWLRNVLTEKRQQKLADLGFKPDPAFGNFVILIPKSAPSVVLTAKIVMAMAQGYGAQLDDVSVKMERLKSARCHPRILPDATGAP